MCLLYLRHVVMTVICEYAYMPTHDTSISVCTTQVYQLYRKLVSV